MTYFTIYKTTNLLNNKYYIGAHRTTNLQDSYLGSGNAIKAAIEKYGKENFTKEVLHILESEEDMYALERKIINENIVNDPNSYNLTLGGVGGSLIYLFDTGMIIL